MLATRWRRRCWRSWRLALRPNGSRVAAGSPDAPELLRAAARQLDKAASKGVIHANQAANRKSALAKQAASL